jgi:hypothetical protein
MRTRVANTFRALEAAMICLLFLPGLHAFAQDSAKPSILNAAEFEWSVSPGDDLNQPGPKTVSLPSCPRGVKGAELEYWVYVAGTGKPEAVKIAGGTCAGNRSAGTLQFTTTAPHSAGYTIGSASAGLQEALIAAQFIPSNPTGIAQSGKVIVPPGEFNAYARISIRASNMTVDFTGSIVDCWMDDTCIYVGDPRGAGHSLDITVINPRGRAMVVGGQHPFLEVNASKTRLFSVSTRVPGKGGTFSSYVQVDDDQAFLLDGLDTSLGQTYGVGGVLCNRTTCNPVIYAPGGGKTFAVGWLKHLNLTMGCTANGIDWESGNSLRVSDSVIQGYPQYALRTGTAHGGYQGTTIENVYGEIGNCKNPAGNIGQAGVIAQGGRIIMHGDLALPGASPRFANTGKTEYRYYIIARSAKFGPSNPLYAGKALTNESGSIAITTPDIPGAASFDLLRVTYSTSEDIRLQAPNGSGNYAVVTGVSRDSACSNGVCTFTDSQAPLSSYTVAPPGYLPLLSFWPGSTILSVPRDISAAIYSEASIAIMDRMIDGVVSVLGAASPAVSASYCNSVAEWTPEIAICLATNFNFNVQPAMLLPVKKLNDGGKGTNLKGRTNYGTLGSGPSHIITLSDSNFGKTVATANNRPKNDSNDAFIGYDQQVSTPSKVGVSFGAPESLSNYIGNAGDGTSWLERLTPNLKSFRVPITTNSQIISSVSTGTPPLLVASTTPVANLTLRNHPQVESCGNANTCVGNVLMNGQVVFGSVTLAEGSARVNSFKPGFSSTSTFQCTASDRTNASNSANAVPLSPTGIAVTGKGADVISYICVGN